MTVTGGVNDSENSRALSPVQSQDPWKPSLVCNSPEEAETTKKKHPLRYDRKVGTEGAEPLWEAT